MSGNVYLVDYRSRLKTPWKEVRERLRALWAPELLGRMDFHHEPFARRGCSDASYWITIDREVIWDFPMQYYGDRLNPPRRGEPIDKRWGSFYETERVLHTYLQMPRANLFDEMQMQGMYHTKPMKIDQWDLGDLLRAADRRVGYRKLMYWAIFKLDGGSPARAVLRARFENRKRC